MVVFEWVADVLQITLTTATSVMAHTNITLSKIAHPHIRTMMGKVLGSGRLLTMAHEAVSAVMLLLLRKDIIEAAQKADKGLIDVRTYESWMDLKIIVPYRRYRHLEGLADLRAQIKAENKGISITPTSRQWMRAKRTVE